MYVCIYAMYVYMLCMLCILCMLCMLCMYAMYVCMYVWMDGWMDGCMYVCMYDIHEVLKERADKKMQRMWLSNATESSSWPDPSGPNSCIVT